jgi:HD-like signal output (HDOD) protein
MASATEFRERIAHITNLPTLPQLASRLMKVINNPVTSASDVSFIIGQDLSLSARVLRLANSAFYGMPRSITNINNAVVILGLRVIHTLVLSLTVFDMFTADKQGSLFNRQAFWRHSLGCGLIAKMLAERMKKFAPFEPEEAFCAGLMHDIGRVVLEQYLHDEFRAVLEFAAREQCSILEAERQVLTITHTDVADWLTEEWELPDEIRLPILHHHQPELAESQTEIISLCHYADHLCNHAGFGLGDDFAHPPLHQGCIEELRIPAKAVEEIVKKLPAEVEKMDIFLDIAAER